MLEVKWVSGRAYWPVPVPGSPFPAPNGPVGLKATPDHAEVAAVAFTAR
ncbi:hypothetical protein [Nonomuraea sp. NPDC049625]